MNTLGSFSLGGVGFSSNRFRVSRCKHPPRKAETERGWKRLLYKISIDSWVQMIRSAENGGKEVRF